MHKLAVSQDYLSYIERGVEGQHQKILVRAAFSSFLGQGNSKTFFLGGHINWKLFSIKTNILFLPDLFKIVLNIGHWIRNLFASILPLLERTIYINYTYIYIFKAILLFLTWWGFITENRELNRNNRNNLSNM